MFTRNVTLRLRENAAPEFNRLIENEILPMLRKQQGFRDEITLVSPGRLEAVVISFFETKEDLETYDRDGSSQLLKIVEKVVDGTPKVEGFELLNSTMHRVAAKG